MTVAEGNRMRLQCRAEGYPDNITYRWYRDGIDVQLIPGLMQVGRSFTRIYLFTSCRPQQLVYYNVSALRASIWVTRI